MLRRLLPLASLLLAPAPAPAAHTLDRVVMLMRHGVRAPLDGEAPAVAAPDRPWPRWPVPPSRLTPHGAEAVRQIGADLRRDLVRAGLLAREGCPAAGTVSIRTNSADRTIATGEALAEGLAPGCALDVGHKPPGETDALFEPLAAHATDYDPDAAIASIMRSTGGLDRLTDRHRAEIADLEHVLGCATPAGCGIAALPASVAPSPDRHGIDLTGPIRVASGVAQVLLLEYAEGMPRAAVGWGRADAATIRRLGALHAALFDVYTRPPAMAAHQSAVFGRHMLDALTAEDPRVLDILVGHDTNVTALGALLGVPLRAPGFADGDVSPGGALRLERSHDAHGRRFVRVVYQSPSLEQIRAAAPGPFHRAVLRVEGCGGATACPLDRFVALVRARLAPLRMSGTAAVTPSARAAP